MMRLLLILALGQIVVITLLYLKVDAFEQQIERSAPFPVAQAAARAGQPSPGPAPAAAGSPALDDAALRRVIREELRFARLEWADTQRAADEPLPLYDEAEMQRRQEKVQDELDYLKGLDEVSPAELDLLLADIARLDPERRSEALRELNRAMNTGEIRGNL